MRQLLLRSVDYLASRLSGWDLNKSGRREEWEERRVEGRGGEGRGGGGKEKKKEEEGGEKESKRRREIRRGRIEGEKVKHTHTLAGEHMACQYSHQTPNTHLTRFF